MAGRRGRPPNSQRRIDTTVGNNVSTGDSVAGESGRDPDSAESTGPATYTIAGTEIGSTEPVAGTQTAVADATGDGTARRRGRPPGSTAKAKTAPINISGIETLLLGISKTLAAATGIEELDLEGDAHNIAKAYADVALYYPILALDPKIAAIANLGSTVAIVAGAKWATYKLRKHNEHGSRVSQHRAAPAFAETATARQADNTPPVQQMNGAINGVDLNKPAPRDVPPDIRTGEIPGVGRIEFGPDHPLVGVKRH